VVARDTFTGTNGTLLTAHVPDVSPSAMWVQQEGTTASLSSGWTAAGTSADYGIATLQTGAADGSVLVDVTSSSAAPFTGVVFRVVDKNRLLLLRYAGNASAGLLGLFRRVNGSFELIEQVTITPMAAGTSHRLGAQLSGSRVQVMWDGVMVFERTVTDYTTATQHGVIWHSDDKTARFDNFVVTASGTGPAPPPPVNAAPVVSGPSNQTHVRGTSVSVPIVATDPEGAALQYGASGVPAGVSVNTSTGVLSGTLNTAGTYAVTVTASDGTTTSTRAFTWTVTTPAPAPPPPAPAPPPPAPAPGVVARDTFTGASGTMLTTHTPDLSTGGMWVQMEGATGSLDSGLLAAGPGAGYGVATLQTGAANGTVRADVSSSNGAAYAGIVFRAVDSNRMLLLRYTGNSEVGMLGLFRRINGNFTLVQQMNVAPAATGTTHRLEARFTGSSVQAVWDGVVVFQQTVTDYATATQHGVLWHSDDRLARFDEFVVTSN